MKAKLLWSKTVLQKEFAALDCIQCKLHQEKIVRMSLTAQQFQFEFQLEQQFSSSFGSVGTALILIHIYENID